jgi:hypothetical protein
VRIQKTPDHRLSFMVVKAPLAGDAPSGRRGDGGIRERLRLLSEGQADRFDRHETRAPIGWRTRD